MSIETKTRDYVSLATALLDPAKAHMRIDGTNDDTLIIQKLAQAIDWFERYTQISVFATAYDWKPGSGDFCSGSAKVPITPVNTGWTVKNGSNIDMTVSYSMETESMHGISLYSLVGSFVDGMKVSIVSGYSDIATLPPGIADVIMRYSAHLYEHREILVPGAAISTPGFLSDVISTYWMPRV